MSEPSFCDISIIKGKQIIWTIDLAPKENGQEEAPQISIASPQNLYQIAQNHINDISRTINTTIPPNNPNTIANNIRTLAKKIIKCKRIRLSEISSQVLFLGNLNSLNILLATFKEKQFEKVACKR